MSPRSRTVGEPKMAWFFSTFLVPFSLSYHFYLFIYTNFYKCICPLYVFLSVTDPEPVSVLLRKRGNLVTCRTGKYDPVSWRPSRRCGNISRKAFANVDGLANLEAKIVILNNYRYGSTQASLCFYNMGKSRLLFCLFSSFLHNIILI